MGILYRAALSELPVPDAARRSADESTRGRAALSRSADVAGRSACRGCLDRPCSTPPGFEAGRAMGCGVAAGLSAVDFRPMTAVICLAIFVTEVRAERPAGGSMTSHGSAGRPPRGGSAPAPRCQGKPAANNTRPGRMRQKAEAV